MLILDDLLWLEALLKQRGLSASGTLREGGRLMPLVNPYVAPEPDGLVPPVDPDFALGASWSLAPELAI